MGAEKLATEIRKEQILRAALEIAAEKGFSGLSVGAVARRVGLVPSAIYRHFGGKHEVIEGILGLMQENLAANARAALENSDHAIERLHVLLRLHLRFIRENRAVPRLIFSEEIYEGSPDRRRRAYGIIKGYLEKIEGILREGQRRGEIRDDLDPATMSMMFIGIIQPSVFLWRLSDGALDVTRQAEKSWTVFKAAVEP